MGRHSKTSKLLTVTSFIVSSGVDTVLKHLIFYHNLEKDTQKTTNSNIKLS